MAEDPYCVDHGETTDVVAFVREAVTRDEGIDDETRQQILGFGQDAVPCLISFLEDESLHLEGSPGDGWAPIRATDLLADLKTSDAVEPMLRALASCEPLEVLHDSLLQGLAEMGEHALEPALSAYRQTDSSEHRKTLCCVLSRLGVHDERVLEALRKLLLESTELGAMCLGDYGDPSAIDDLSDALDREEVQLGEAVLRNHVFIELRAAIEMLGGSLTEAQLDKCQRAGMRDEMIFGAPKDPVRPNADTPHRRERKVGRNEPCWCGSGKKYKKCHWTQDH